MTSVSLRLRSASACLSIGAFLLSVLAGPAPVSAQVLYGSIVGNVVDETGSAVPGAAVTISAGGTGASREVVSDATGAFRFLTVQPGTYTVTVSRRVPPFVPPTSPSTERRRACRCGAGRRQPTRRDRCRPTPVRQTWGGAFELKARDLVAPAVSMNRNYHTFPVLPFHPPAEPTRCRPTPRAPWSSTSPGHRSFQKRPILTALARPHLAPARGGLLPGAGVARNRQLVTHARRRQVLAVGSAINGRSRSAPQLPGSASNTSPTSAADETTSRPPSGGGV